ncbi:uncharacterized protein LOC130088363 [Rhinichthys klamathensis goyatoka]|uniref:uncharacterized protein LOC130088363 n=1 Tax=Rhinichthys klamathensis goyatoka TaxID=3034132 RepID=UPI0024B5BB6E|nr:uncharacterized protein LOC130088363 [Rhinichthys klamathensis goyatoka]
MTRNIISLILFLRWSQGTLGGDDVVQEPKILWKPKASSADMNCSHKKGISYYQMYWYRQRPGETMRLIVFTVANSKPEFGDVDENKFEAHKSDAESGSLTVKDLEPEDGAIYFCSQKHLMKPMMNTLLSVSVSLLMLTAACLGKTVDQTPDNLIKNQDESAVIICAHDIPSYNQILWYKQSQDTSGLKLMGYLYFKDETKESEFTNKIKLEGDAQKKGNLSINSLRLNDSAVYFCAAYYTVFTITSDSYKNLLF